MARRLLNCPRDLARARPRPASRRLAALACFVALACLVALAAAGCCGSPRHAFPMPTPPDRQCDIAWSDVYVWTCVQGQHVVIHRFRGEWGCDRPVREVSACGTLTPFEQNHRGDDLARCPPTSVPW